VRRSQCRAKNTKGKVFGLTLCARPSTKLPGEFDADDLRTLQFPGHARHGVNRISSANTNAQHAHASSIGCVRICTDDQATRAFRSQHTWPVTDSIATSCNSQSVILQDNSMNNARARLPESNAVFLRGTAQKVVDLHNLVRPRFFLSTWAEQYSPPHNRPLRLPDPPQRRSPRRSSDRCGSK
jgi:hypothetical protein